jgi:exosortase/archaeosortase family protein
MGPLGGELRAGICGVLAAGLAKGGLWLFPQAELEWFARGAASLAALLTGAPVARVEQGWLLAGAAQPVVVSELCSATGYFVVVAALLGWRLAQIRGAFLPALAGAMVAAFPVTLAVNALRVVAVIQAHRWVIPKFPAAYASFLHLLVGVGVFLPALIALNLLLEFYGNSRRRVR